MWALIINGTVAEVTDIDPAGRFHASWDWRACPDTVEPGWCFDSGAFGPSAGLSSEGLAVAERLWRDGELSANEWLVARHRDEQDMNDTTTLSAEQFAQLLVFRKALRDWPEGVSFPNSKNRPAQPDWLSTAAAS